MALKRMSSTEKQTKLLSSIHYNTFYHIKELEKLTIKLDIRSPAKELVDYLVAENLIKQEKIGISNIYFKKPTDHSKELSKLQQELQTINSSIKSVEKNIKESEEMLSDEENIAKQRELDDLKNV